MNWTARSCGNLMIDEWEREKEAASSSRNQWGKVTFLRGEGGMMREKGNANMASASAG